MAVRQQILDYLRQYEDQYPMEQLRAQLLKQNIPPVEVDEAVQTVQGVPAMPAPQPTQAEDLAAPASAVIQPQALRQTEPPPVVASRTGEPAKPATTAPAEVAPFVIACPSCHRAIPVPKPRVGRKLGCQQCGKEFDIPPNEEIEKSRENAPAHSWRVIKRGGGELSVQGLDAIEKAILDGSISPSDHAVAGPFLPAVSVRELAGAENRLKKLYDPLSVFADHWSWGLVALIPTVCLALIGLLVGAGPAMGLLWPVAILVIAFAGLLFMLAGLIMKIPVLGPMIVFVGTGFIGYIALAVVGGGGFVVLILIHEAFLPVARMIGKAAKAEEKRIANWQQWMEPVKDAQNGSA